jgi:hypothetical protein
MTDILDTLIAPKLHRKNYTPLRSKDLSKYDWQYWHIRDYPGYGAHGKDSQIGIRAIGIQHLIYLKTVFMVVFSMSLQLLDENCFLDLQ